MDCPSDAKAGPRECGLTLRHTSGGKIVKGGLNGRLPNGKNDVDLISMLCHNDVSFAVGIGATRSTIQYRFPRCCFGMNSHSNPKTQSNIIYGHSIFG